jgi:spore germination protein GerM
MNAFFNTIISLISNFLSSAVRRRLVLVGILGIIALSEFLFLGLARRTFVFYTIDDGIIVVEDRMLKHSNSKEGDIIRYMEEMLLGPVSPELLPLFPLETRLKSLLYRNGVVYADFSEDAVFPPIGGGSTLNNFMTLHTGILRNFSYVKDVRFFIEGNAVYVEEFKHREI